MCVKLEIVHKGEKYSLRNTSRMQTLNLLVNYLSLDFGLVTQLAV